MAGRLVKIVVMGVAACGKTSVGVALAARCGMAFVDGDDLHPAQNIAKMARGEPLTDEDRAPWLDRVGTVLADRAAHPGGVVVACSALRRLYRDQIRAAAGPGLAFVFLDITVEEARRRIALRTSHFMPPALVDSQFATLERPLAEPDVVTIGRLVDPAGVAEDAVAAFARLPSDPGLTDRTIPPAPLLLGLAGLLPFWGLAIGLVFAPLAGWTAAQLAFALCAYGAVIVSFLGGIRWGLATAAPREAAAAQYGLAVVPSLLAWAALALPAPACLAGLGVVALGLGPLDRPLVTAGLAPAWFGRLRLILSGGAGAALGFAALILWLRP